MNSIAVKVKKLQDEIAENIKIIAVSKYVNEDEIIKAYDAGIRDFAESKIQDAINKLNNLPSEVVSNSNWHFIGHIQSNKTRKVLEKFDYIHSVDSLKLAKNISRIATEEGKTTKILLQVNVADEKSKFGFNPETLKEEFSEIIKLESINVVGLMLIAPYSDNTDFLRRQFKKLRNLRDELEKKYHCKLTELSMGMSSDYALALEEGATMLRLGSIIFK